MKFNDCSLFPIFQPEITGNISIMHVFLTITLLPVVEFTAADLNPGCKRAQEDSGSLCPMFQVINHQIPYIMGNP